jgi:crossover junction endodeoxyribonuclease RuvC
MHSTSSPKRILGIDPGSHRLGVGCVEQHGNTLRLLFAETIEAPARESLYDRLEVIVARLKKVIDALSPDEVAVEDIFHAKNARSAFHLGMARGVAISACLGRGVRIYEYAPTQVKAIVTGYGRADKEQVRKMVRLILGAQIELGYDATDAIAIAICHANTAHLNSALRG